MQICAIFVLWDPNGEIPPFVEFYINSLKKVASKVIVVVNGECVDQNLARFGDVVFVIRENLGYDFWGYKEGLESLGYENLNRYSKIILCNSSCYGPLFDIQIVIDEMSKKNLDFWGITEWRAGIWPNHIQSYFYAFEHKLISSSDFKYYWQNLPYVRTREEAILCLETRLTQHFEKLGFSWGTYKQFQTYFPRDDESDQLSVERIIKEIHTPFIKRKAMIQLKSSRIKYQYVLSIISKLGYDTQLIISDIGQIPTKPCKRNLFFTPILKPLKILLKMTRLYESLHKAWQTFSIWKIYRRRNF